MQQSILESTRETSVLQQWRRRRLTKHTAAADKQEREQTGFHESIRRGRDCYKDGGMEHEGRGQTNRKGKKPGLHIQQWRKTKKAARTCLMDWRENRTVGFTTSLSKFSDKNILFKVLVYFELINASFP